LKQTIYVDILLAVNLIINYFLLRITAKMALPYTKRRRIFLGAAIGAVFSFIIFLPNLHWSVMGLIKLIFSVTIVATTFGIKDVKRFLRCTAIFFIANFLFAGGMIAFFILFSPNGMYINNSVVYFNFSAVTLIGIAAIIYILISLLTHFTKKRSLGDMEYVATIEYSGRSTAIGAMVDTGCDLSEVFSATPVCVCEFNAVKDILPKKLATLISSSFSNIGKVAKSEYGKDLRLVPYTDVSGSGILCAIRPSRFLLTQKNVQVEVDRVYIAFTNKSLSNGEYQCLINPQVIENNTAKRGVGQHEQRQQDSEQAENSLSSGP